MSLETTVFTFKISVPFEEWAAVYDSEENIQMADITLIDQKKLISFFVSNENNWFVTHKELNILFDQYKINNE